MGRRLVRASRARRAPRLDRATRETVGAREGLALLVECGVPGSDRLLPGAFVLGSDPYDDRVTCLADVRVPGSLPSNTFDVIALFDTRTRGHANVVENAFGALRPGGALVCGAWGLAERSLRRRFDEVLGHGFGPWRVVAARKGHS